MTESLYAFYLLFSTGIFRKYVFIWWMRSETTFLEVRAAYYNLKTAAIMEKAQKAQKEGNI